MLLEFVCRFELVNSVVFFEPGDVFAFSDYGPNLGIYCTQYWTEACAEEVDRVLDQHQDRMRVWPGCKTESSPDKQMDHDCLGWKLIVSPYRCQDDEGE
jgi:hypothetical protein